MPTQPGINQVKAINSISRKFYLSQAELTDYYKGIREGESENSLLADMLKAPVGADPLQYLNSFLSPQELTSLKRMLREMAPKTNKKNQTK